MFIRFFTSGMPLPQYAGIFLTAVLLWAGVLVQYPDNPVFYFQCQWVPVVGAIQGFSQSYPLVAAGVAVVFITIQALWVSALARIMGFVSKTSLLPAFIYMLAVGAPVEGVLALQIIIANFFVLALIQAIVYACFYDYPLKNIFHGSLMAALGSLFYLPVLGLWIFLLLAFILVRAFSWRVLLFALLAFLPVAGGLIIYYLYANIPLSHLYLHQFCTLSWSMVYALSPMQLYIILFLLGVLILLIWLKVSRFASQVINLRRLSSVILWYVLFVVMLCGFVENPLMQTAMLAPGLALLSGDLAGGVKRRTAGNLILWLFILGMALLRVEHLIFTG